MRCTNFGFKVLICVMCFLALGATAQQATPSAWMQLAELTPTNRMNQDWFGVSVAVSSNTVVVGAFDGNIETTGAAYVFVKPANGWGNMTQTAILTPSDGGAGFGISVAISGNTIIVGAANASNQVSQTQGPGAAYVFVKPAGGWKDMAQTAKLTASDGANGDAFGYNVSVSGNTAVVGAIFAHSGAGAAYVFVKPSTGWKNMTQIAELQASDATTFDNMGAVSIRQNTVITGAPGHNNFQGAAYIFMKPSTGWKNTTQTAEIKSKRANEIYGFSVAIGTNTALVGAQGRVRALGRRTCT